MMQVIYYIIEHIKSKRICYTTQKPKQAEAMLKKLVPDEWAIKKYDLITKQFIT